VAAMGEHVPERRVAAGGHRDGHVVGHHVNHHAQTEPVGVCGQALQPLAAAEHRADPGVVDDVVAMRGSGSGGQDGGEVEVGDAQVVQVLQDGGGLGEGEVGAELEAVGGNGDVRAHSSSCSFSPSGRAMITMLRGGRVRSLPGPSPSGRSRVVSELSTGVHHLPYSSSGTVKVTGSTLAEVSTSRESSWTGRPWASGSAMAPPLRKIISDRANEVVQASVSIWLPLGSNQAISGSPSSESSPTVAPVKNLRRRNTGWSRRKLISCRVKACSAVSGSSQAIQA